MNLIEFGKEKLPSILNDPFKKNCVTKILVWCQESIWTSEKDKWEANGCVYFRNNQTTGEQNFKGQSFDEVVIKIKEFLKTLE